MKNKTLTRTAMVLSVMPFIVWLTCFGFVIKGGSILISYFVSYNHQVAAKNLYMGLNLYELRQYSFLYYSISVSFLVAIPAMKAWVCFLVAKTLSKFNLNNPFTMEVAIKLEQISYVALFTWVVTMLSNTYTSWLMKTTGKMYGNMLSGEFIFMAGLVFVIAQVFKRGVEIQTENELTV